MPAIIRAFVAADLPDEIRDRLGETQRRLRDRLARAGIDRGLKWTQPAGIHLTLKFLGETDEALIPELGQELAAVVAAQPTLTLALAGPGVFPNPRAPRVVWIGVEGDVPALMTLQSRVEAALSPLGFPTESRPFSPHLTLARVAEVVSREDRERIGAAVLSTPAREAVAFQIHTVSLIRSELLPGGARYTPVFVAETRAQ